MKWTDLQLSWFNLSLLLSLTLSARLWARPADLLDRISESQRRLWIIAPEPLDSDTLAALAVAEYRRVDVRLVHKFPLNSRLVNLKRARQDDTPHKWLMLQDRQWFAWEKDQSLPMTNEEKRWLLEKFGAPVPSRVATGHNQRGSLTADNTSGAYRYDRQQRVASDQGMPKQLPKQPLYLRRQRETTGSAPLLSDKVLTPPTAVEPWIKSMNGPECY